MPQKTRPQPQKRFWFRCRAEAELPSAVTLQKIYLKLVQVLPWIGWIVGLLLAAGILVLYFLLPNEPKYNGKMLSAWLQDLDSNRPDVQASAADALKHIGEKAVPSLVARLDYPINRRNSQFYKLKEKVLNCWASNPF